MLKMPSIRIGLFVGGAAVAAACGPSTPQGEVPPQPSATPSAAPSATPSVTPTAEPSAAPSATPPPPPPKAAAPSVNVGASALLADATKIVDLKKAGPLAKLKSADKKKLMPLFQKALGFKDCTGCHAPGKSKDEPIDVKVETHNMKMARGMWDNFIVKLRDEKGGAVFCDSCHTGAAGGTAHLLERADRDALSKFMEENYQNKFTHPDKSEHNCGSCHGDPFESKVFAKVWKVD